MSTTTEIDDQGWPDAATKDDVADRRDHIDRQFDRIDQRFTTLDERFDTVTAQIVGDVTTVIRWAVGLATAYLSLLTILVHLLR